MNIPKTIIILGRKFTVRIVPPKIIKSHFGEDILAGVDYSKKIIFIPNDEPNYDQAIAFFHECTHCVLFITGLDQIIPKNIAEIICESVANGVWDIFKAIE